MWPERPSVETGATVPGYNGGLAAGVVVSDSCLDGCGPQAKCESRDQRAQLQWRLDRRVVVSYPRPEGSGARQCFIFFRLHFCLFSPLSAFRFYFNQRLTAMMMPMVAAIRRTHRAGMRWASFAPTIEPGTDPAISQTASDQSTCPWIRK